MVEKKKSPVSRYNMVTAFGYATIALVLVLSYILEYVKGNRTIGYLLIFCALSLIPMIACLIFFLRDKESIFVKYTFAIGYSILYVFVILTATTSYCYVYIVLLFIIITPYADFRLSGITSLVAIIANIVQLVIKANGTGFTAVEVTSAEIQMAFLSLSGFYALMTARITKSSNVNEMKKLNDEKEKGARLLEKILVLSENISTEITNANTKMETLQHTVETTTSSMIDVSNGSTETAESVQEQLMKTEEIVEQVDKVKNVSSTIAADMIKTKEALNVGMKSVQKLVQQVQESEKVGDAVSERMQQLHDNTEKMNDIVGLINSITKQTSMLSLNASIEAARVGEAGKGFAVVANEISNLAKQTSDATISITGLISTITDSIEEVYQSMTKLMESNKIQNDTAGTLEGNFTNISNSAENIDILSSQLENIVVTLESANRVIVESVHNISAITEEVSARASETSSESESSNKAVNELAQMMQKLQNMAQELSRE